MAVFNFPYHTIEVKYPESSVKVAFGGGYEFASKPKAPDQVEYTLSFPAMFFFETVPGVEDVTPHPAVNMTVLENFYNAHKMYEKFTYPHPTKGNIQVRFGDPLSYKIVSNGKGRVEPFSIKLISQP